MVFSKRSFCLKIDLVILKKNIFVLVVKINTSWIPLFTNILFVGIEPYSVH